MTVTKTAQRGMPQTLMQAHEELVRSRPCRKASLSVWLAYYQHSVAVYGQIAKTDPRHEGEAQYWAARERVHARAIEARIRGLGWSGLRYVIEGSSIQWRLSPEGGGLTKRTSAGITSQGRQIPKLKTNHGLRRAFALGEVLGPRTRAMVPHAGPSTIGASPRRSTTREISASVTVMLYELTS